MPTKEELEAELAKVRKERDQLLLDRLDDEPAGGARFYAVFACRPRSDGDGYPIRTVLAPIAVFRAGSADEACRTVAAKSKRLETYFAVEGTPWGADLIAPDHVDELGAEPRLDVEGRLDALERRALPWGTE